MLPTHWLLLTSAQWSTEVRALHRALSFGVCMSALCGLRFTDFRWAAFSCKQRFQFIWIAPDKRTKQSRDWVCVYVLLSRHSHMWLCQDHKLQACKDVSCQFGASSLSWMLTLTTAAGLSSVRAFPICKNNERRCVWVIRKRWPQSSTPDLEFFKRGNKKPSRNEGCEKVRFEPRTPWSVVQRSNH